MAQATAGNRVLPAPAPAVARNCATASDAFLVAKQGWTCTSPTHSCTSRMREALPAFYHAVRPEESRHGLFCNQGITGFPQATWRVPKLLQGLCPRHSERRCCRLPRCRGHGGVRQLSRSDCKLCARCGCRRRRLAECGRCEHPANAGRTRKAVHGGARSSGACSTDAAPPDSHAAQHRLAAAQDLLPGKHVGMRADQRYGGCKIGHGQNKWGTIKG
jgi:hypothetical protein